MTSWRTDADVRRILDGETPLINVVSVQFFLCAYFWKRIIPLNLLISETSYSSIMCIAVLLIFNFLECQNSGKYQVSLFLF